MMIFIVVKFDVARRYREDWMSITKEFTAATRAEPGNSPHFRDGLAAMRPALSRTPLVHTEIDGDGWSAMGELQIDTVASQGGASP